MPARRTQEILMLRKELQVLKRSSKRPKLTSWDRLLFVSLLRLNKRVEGNIVTMSPNTILAWHRKLAARRIVGELRKLGRMISKSTVLNIIKALGFPGDGPRQDQSLYRFLH
jgi:putative transposase